MGGTIVFLVFVGVAGFFFFRMLQSRKDNPEYEKPQRRMSSREKKLAKLEAFDDNIPPRPSIQELMAEEVRETGVDQIPGGEGIEHPILLKVWHRDEHVRAGCTDGALRYVILEGVEPAAATEGDMRLVCDEAAPGPTAGPTSDAEPQLDDRDNESAPSTEHTGPAEQAGPAENPGTNPGDRPL